MSRRDIVAILVQERSEHAITVQKILTGWGCLIRTRLGLHEGVLDGCTQSGLIICEVVGEEEKIEELVRKLNLVPLTEAKRITLGG